MLLLLTVKTFGQTFQIADVDATNFPIVEANILVYDADFSLKTLNLQMVSITENNKPVKPIEFTAPKSSIVPTSIVLVLDISASMIGLRFDLLKKTVKEFIQKLPLEISEVSIATFNDNVILNCDFTHNIITLNNCIDRLNPVGGTNFDKAFLTPFSGALDIAGMGKNRRVIIFITDGLSKVKKYQVANRAKYDSTIISCLTIGLPIGDELKYVTKETGGSYYSDLFSEYEIKTAFDRIYSEVQINTYGKLKWKSANSCSAKKHTIIKLGNQEFDIKYQIPNALVGKIEATVSMLNFSTGSPNKIQFKPVFIRGKNIELNIASINSSNNRLFGCKQKTFPVTAKPNEWKPVKFTFIPSDTIFAINEYTITNPGCPDVIIGASTRGVKKLTITEPLSEDVFVRGANILIKWEGIDKQTPVEFLYQVNGYKNWIPFGIGTQYHKNWKAPVINSKIRIQGQVTNNITFSNLISSNVVLIDGSEFKSAYYNTKGSEILTLSTGGVMKNWDAQSGFVKHSFENKVWGNIAFFPGYNRVVNITDSLFEVFTNRNGLFMIGIPTGKTKTQSSFTHVNGKELYASLINYNSLTQITKNLPNGSYTAGAASPKGNYVIARKKSLINIIKQRPLKKWFSIKLDKNFEKAVLHSTEDICVVVNTNSAILYNLNSKNIIKKFANERFSQYTESGLHIITTDSINAYINDIKTGRRLFDIPANCDFALSKNGNYIAYINNDSLIIASLTLHKNVLIRQVKSLQKIQFFPKSDKLVLLQNDTLSIINYKIQQTELSVFAEPGLIKMIDIAPNEKSLLITTPQVVSIWKIEKHFDADTTPYFKIIVPEPEVVQKILFNKQHINIANESIFKNILTNPTKYPLIIDSVYINDNTFSFALVSSAGSFTLKPFEKQSVEIRFNPHTTKKFEGVLVVVSANKKYKCLISGIGINSSFSLPTPLVNFKLIPINTKTDTLIPVIINTGTEPLLVKDFDLSQKNGSGFTISTTQELPALLNAHDTLWAKAAFKPHNRGRQNTILYVNLESSKRVNTTELFGIGNAKRQVIIAGKTINAITQENLPSIIKLTELNSGKTIHNLPTNAMGHFTFKANADLNYSITAHLNGFFSSSENIDLTQPQTTDTIWTEILLTPIVNGSIVRLNNIFFEFAKAELLEQSKTELMRIVVFMNKQPKLNVEIHGHTDNIGDTENNLQLSKLRAESVKKYMVNQGILTNRIVIKYFGKDRPIESNNTLLGRKINRRVEIKFQ